MNIVKISDSTNWEDVKTKVVSGKTIVLSKDDLLVGFNHAVIKKVHKYNYVVGTLFEADSDKEFIAFLQNEYEINAIYSTRSLDRIISIIKKIFKAHDRWQKLITFR